MLSDEPTAREFAVLERLRTRLPAIGDDAAVLADGLLASTDSLVAGIDWRDEWSSPADLGWKAVMVNASDIAAMGGQPAWFLVSLVLQPGFDVDAFYDGAIEASTAVGATIVGGDLSSGPTTVVTVTALGRAARPVLRSGAQVGDGVWVTGPVGAAAAELRDFRRIGAGRGGPMRRKSDGEAHRRPVARVNAGLAAAAAGATAMIDLSDGFVADAAHVAEASGLSLALDTVPIAVGATRGDALYGGDDYELLATAAAGVELDGWIRIGACATGPHAVTINGFLVDPHGWEHEL